MEWWESGCRWIAGVRQGQINEVGEKGSDRVETVLVAFSRSLRYM